MAGAYSADSGTKNGSNIQKVAALVAKETNGAGESVGIDQATAHQDMGDGKAERCLKRKVFSHRSTFLACTETVNEQPSPMISVLVYKRRPREQARPSSAN